MKAFLLFCTLGLTTLASAVTAAYDDDLLFTRAINSKCKAPLGRGTCQHTANCPGVSYPTGLCPKDPKDVQVCLGFWCMFQSKLISHDSAVTTKPATSQRSAQVIAEVSRITAARVEIFILVSAQEIKISNAVSRIARSRQRHQNLPRPALARPLRLRSSFSKTAYLPSSPPSVHRTPLVSSGRTTAAAVRPMISANSTSHPLAGAMTSDTGIQKIRVASMTR